MNYKYVTSSAIETIEVAEKIMSKKFPNMVICLDGDLGSGKTIFTKGIANGLKIREVITSPTFTIIKEYLDGDFPMYHMDVYRLGGNTDGIGIEEYFSKGGIVVIEWSSTIKDILPNQRLDVTIKTGTESQRVLFFEPHGKKYEELCEVIL